LIKINLILNLSAHLPIKYLSQSLIHHHHTLINLVKFLLMSRILLKETPEILHNEGDMALFLVIGHWSLVIGH